MKLEETLHGLTSAVISVGIVVIVVVLLWYILWKLALESNPLIRDFFDLDPPKKKKAK